MILEGKNEKKTDKVTESVIESCDMESHFNINPVPVHAKKGGQLAAY